MALEVTFNNNVVTGGKSVVTAADDVDMKFSATGNQIHNVENVFNIYSPARIAALGLTDQIHPEVLDQVVAQINEMPDASEAEKIEVVANSRLKNFIAHGTDLLTMAKSVVEIAATVLKIP
jgi:hypothetical protein